MLDMWEEQGSSIRRLSVVALRCVLRSLMSLPSSAERKTKEEGDGINSLFAQKDTVCTNYIFTFVLSNFYLLIIPFPCAQWRLVNLLGGAESW